MSDVDRIVTWAEKKANDAAVVAAEANASPKRVGRGAHLTEDEKHMIRLAYLEQPRTFKALGAMFNRNRETIAECCRGPEFQALRKKIEAEGRQVAIDRLKGMGTMAVDAYETAIPIAAEKGDVRPAKDVLKHLGIMEETEGGKAGVLVLTKVEINGVSFLKGSDGNMYERDPDTGEIPDLPHASVVMQVGALTAKDVKIKPPTSEAVDGEVVQ